MRLQRISIALCLFLMLGGKAIAFCYAPQLRVSDEYFVSELVVTGTVTDARDVINPSDKESATGTYYTVRIDTTYRGKPYRSLHVYSENSTARFPMEKGVQYVLFLSHDPYKNWFVDNCGNSGEILRAASTMEQIKQLPLKRSFVYGEIYSWGDPGKCESMQLSLHSEKLVIATTVKGDCSFEVDAPPGRYEATMQRDGISVYPNAPNYKDLYCFVVPVGGSAGIAFRLADGIDELNRKMLLKDARHARSLCSKSRAPQYLF